ncbi:MAG: hypothetical protein LPK00_08125 [Bacillaceae bacterium]|mgnify:CR=1 FL=1|nr:hypothetical protein [Bacillaceae bacterium]
MPKKKKEIDDNSLEVLENGNVEDLGEKELAPEKKYVVICDFKDLKDNNTIYIKGDIYPRRAETVIEEERIQELMSTDNKIGKQLIQEQA